MPVWSARCQTINTGYQFIVIAVPAAMLALGPNRMLYEAHAQPAPGIFHQ